MSEKTRQPKIIYILAVLMLLALVFVGYTSYRVITLEPGQQQVTTAGTIAKPSNNVKDATIGQDGSLVLTYEDGTTRIVGNITGATGAVGPAPSQAEIAIAVANYCSSGRCDAKNPSSEQVAAAVVAYCTVNSGCKGDNGVNGKDVTAEQVMAAVSQYCADGRCTGPAGPVGAAGADGRTAILSCVTRDDAQYVAWRYEAEANSAYRDLYQLPPLAQGSNCVDLRS
jgi:hypothetical protein